MRSCLIQRIADNESKEQIRESQLKPRDEGIRTAVVIRALILVTSGGPPDQDAGQ